MQAAFYAAMFFTVAMLVTTAYFLMGGLPLLILKHDVALDARFVRSFFNLYYQVAMVASLGAAISFGLAGRMAFAVGAGVLVLVTWLLRGRFIPAMEVFGVQIQDRLDGAVRRFRRVHATALAINFAQLVTIVWGLRQLQL